MGTLRPALRGDEFDGEGGIDSSNKDSRLVSVLKKLDAAATNLGVFTNATRPTTLPQWQALGFDAIPTVGTITIYNSSDNAPNYWDGSGWRDASGAVT